MLDIFGIFGILSVLQSFAKGGERKLSGERNLNPFSPTEMKSVCVILLLLTRSALRSPQSRRKKRQIIRKG